MSRTTPTILLLGKNGQVGWELQRSLSPLGRLVALDRNSTQACGDLCRLEDLVRTVRTYQPSIIVNAAAHTAVDKAESESELAYQVNAEAPAILAQEAERLGAWLVHYSTDYVFDGSGTSPRDEDDPTGPLSVYGASKLAGEQAIRAICTRHIIFRTSWVFGVRGGNFAKTMLKLAQTKDELSVISDQIGAPTGADLIADVTALALQTIKHNPSEVAALSGLFHLVASGQTSWYAYAKYVLQQAKNQGLTLKVEPESIKPIPSSAYPTAATRPLNSRLATGKLESRFGLCLPDWQIGLDRMLALHFSKV